MSWTLWAAVSLGTLGALAQRMQNPDASKEMFLPGETTHGHYQIELECAACHSEAFASSDDFQTACMECHGDELDEAEDSHPVSKFSDPRNADRVEQLDARFCVTCHSEHQPSRTGSMGLSLPDDYCYHCHQDIEEERSSHAGLAFDSCAEGGCHNFHDNRALYEDFLVKHGNEGALTAQPFRPQAPIQESCPAPVRHRAEGLEIPDACGDCHEAETKSWLSGRHGMRVAQGLEPMKPGRARLPMNADVAHESLTCGSCHQPGGPEGLIQAQVETCESCHADEHTKNYRMSKHFDLVQREVAGRVASGAGVTCATCHLPRSRDESGEEWVNHNQNSNLRPNEKMIRSVCGDCHGVPFVIDALADTQLVKNNFSGRPSEHVPSVDFALARE